MKYLRKKNYSKDVISFSYECASHTYKLQFGKDDAHKIFSLMWILKSNLIIITIMFHPPSMCLLIICLLFYSISVLRVRPCCTTAPQSGSWATCSRISSTSRFFPGGSTIFVIFCCSVRGTAISWINWPSGLLSTCRNTSKINVVKHYPSISYPFYLLSF